MWQMRQRTTGKTTDEESDILVSSSLEEPGGAGMQKKRFHLLHSTRLLCCIWYIIGFLSGMFSTTLLHGSGSTSTAGSERTTTAEKLSSTKKANSDNKDDSLRTTSRPSPAISDKPLIIPADLVDARFGECSGGKKVSSTGGFCLTNRRTTGGNHMKDESLGAGLKELFRNATVIDLGAGLGHYGKMLMEQGSPVLSWIGFDGALNVQQQTDGYVKFMDLTQPDAFDERNCAAMDWVLSLEVAEHIPPKFEDAYLRNIRCHAKVGAVVSWADPGQKGGLGHVNMKKEADAQASMKRWGFEVDTEETTKLRELARLGHFKKQITVYRL